MWAPGLVSSQVRQPVQTLFLRVTKIIYIRHNRITRVVILQINKIVNSWYESFLFVCFFCYLVQQLQWMASHRFGAEGRFGVKGQVSVLPWRLQPPWPLGDGSGRGVGGVGGSKDVDGSPRSSCYRGDVITRRRRTKERKVCVWGGVLLSQRPSFWKREGKKTSSFHITITSASYES